LRLIERSNVNNAISVISTNLSIVKSHKRGLISKTIANLVMGRYIIEHPQNYLIFVENIHEYNIMTAFCQALGFKNIAFLPIFGNYDDATSKNEVISKEMFTKLLDFSKMPIVIINDNKQKSIMKGIQKNANGF
jgi:hypothetical protein